IELRWKTYDEYPEYPQGTDAFNHNVSIIDLLCNVGEEAPYYIWGFRERTELRSWVADNN
ncbi:MAG: WbqC family protein, partial [Lachnospiraceae bacterium]|nr:WbqC family protein [Lachnospiraceae bacterium]